MESVDSHSAHSLSTRLFALPKVFSAKTSVHRTYPIRLEGISPAVPSSGRTSPRNVRQSLARQHEASQTEQSEWREPLGGIPGQSLAPCLALTEPVLHVADGGEPGLFLVVQPLRGLRNVGDVYYRGHYRVRQARGGIDPDVRLSSGPRKTPGRKRLRPG